MSSSSPLPSKVTRGVSKENGRPSCLHGPMIEIENGPGEVGGGQICYQARGSLSSFVKPRFDPTYADFCYVASKQAILLYKTMGEITWQLGASMIRAPLGPVFFSRKSALLTSVQEGDPTGKALHFRDPAMTRITACVFFCGGGRGRRTGVRFQARREFPSKRPHPFGHASKPMVPFWDS